MTKSELRRKIADINLIKVLYKEHGYKDLAAEASKLEEALNEQLKTAKNRTIYWVDLDLNAEHQPCVKVFETEQNEGDFGFYTKKEAIENYLAGQKSNLDRWIRTLNRDMQAVESHTKSKNNCEAILKQTKELLNENV